MNNPDDIVHTSSNDPIARTKSPCLITFTDEISTSNIELNQQKVNQGCEDFVEPTYSTPINETFHSYKHESLSEIENGNISYCVVKNESDQLFVKNCTVQEVDSYEECIKSKVEESSGDSVQAKISKLEKSCSLVNLNHQNKTNPRFNEMENEKNDEVNGLHLIRPRSFQECMSKQYKPFKVKIPNENNFTVPPVIQKQSFESVHKKDDNILLNPQESKEEQKEIISQECNEIESENLISMKKCTHTSSQTIASRVTITKKQTKSASLPRSHKMKNLSQPSIILVLDKSMALDQTLQLETSRCGNQSIRTSPSLQQYKGGGIRVNVSPVRQKGPKEDHPKTVPKLRSRSQSDTVHSGSLKKSVLINELSNKLRKYSSEINSDIEPDPMRPLDDSIVGIKSSLETIYSSDSSCSHGPTKMQYSSLPNKTKKMKRPRQLLRTSSSGVLPESILKRPTMQTNEQTFPLQKDASNIKSSFPSINNYPSVSNTLPLRSKGPDRYRNTSLETGSLQPPQKYLPYERRPSFLQEAIPLQRRRSTQVQAPVSELFQQFERRSNIPESILKPKFKPQRSLVLSPDSTDNAQQSDAESVFNNKPNLCRYQVEGSNLESYSFFKKPSRNEQRFLNNLSRNYQRRESESSLDNFTSKAKKQVSFEKRSAGNFYFYVDDADNGEDSEEIEVTNEDKSKDNKPNH